MALEERRKVMTENEKHAQALEEVARHDDLFHPQWCATLLAAAAALREIDTLRAQLAKGLDYQHHTSCGHVWTMRATACPECFVGLKNENERMRAQLAEIDALKIELSAVDATLGNRSAFDAFKARTDKILHAIKTAAEVAPLKGKVERLEAQLAEARAKTLREVEDAIHAQLTTSLNDGTAMEALIAVGAALREMRASCPPIAKSASPPCAPGSKHRRVS